MNLVQASGAARMSLSLTCVSRLVLRLLRLLDSLVQCHATSNPNTFSLGFVNEFTETWPAAGLHCGEGEVRPLLAALCRKVGIQPIAEDF